MSTELLVPNDNSNHFQCHSLLLAEKSLFSYTDTDVLLEMPWDRLKTSVVGAGTLPQVAKENLHTRTILAVGHFWYNTYLLTEMKGLWV